MTRFHLALVMLLVFGIPEAQKSVADAPRLAVPHSQMTDTVVGSVYDSIANAPLAEAFVIAEPGGVLTATNADGRFVLVSPTKINKIAVFHDATERLGISGLVAVRPDANRPWLDASIATPSMTTLWSRLCPGKRPGAGMGGIIFGVARASDDSTRIHGARVTVQWESTKDVMDTTRRFDTMTATTDSTGEFVFCGVQEFGEAAVVATSDRFKSGAVIVPWSERSLRRVDLVLGVVSAGGDPVTTVVQGRVVDATGAPVADAIVVLEGNTAEVRTNGAGVFAFPEAPTGSRMVSARKVGYLPDWRALDVPAKGVKGLEMTIERGVTLSGVNVSERRTFGRERWELTMRRNAGLGRVMDSADMKRFRATQNAIQVLPGFQIGRLSTRSDRDFVVLGRMGCRAAVYVDGVLDSNNDMGMFQSMHVDDIGLVEAFSSGSQAPARYQSATSSFDCGVLLVWSKVGLRSMR